MDIYEIVTKGSCKHIIDSEEERTEVYTYKGKRYNITVEEEL